MLMGQVATCVHTEDVQCFVSLCSTRNMRPNPEVPSGLCCGGFFPADFAVCCSSHVAAVLPGLLRTHCCLREHRRTVRGRWVCFSHVNGKQKGLGSAQAASCTSRGRWSKSPQNNKKQGGPLWRSHPLLWVPWGSGTHHPQPVLS